MAYTTSVQKIALLPLMFLINAALLAGWAILVMRKSRLRINPVPSPEATLITDGPYQYIRHPMYSAIIVGCTGLLLTHFTWLRLLLTLALIVVLLVKLSWEEKMLKQKFTVYQDYSRHSKRLIPFIY
jgi:protein-S-isoprenylcysteine O-methyltransferase Ste14